MFEVHTIKGTIRLGKAFGVPVRIHHTWFVAVVLITVTLVMTLSGVYPLWQNIILGIIAALICFASMIARTLIQSSVAAGLRAPLKSVTLQVFSGVPRISERDTRPFREVLMALAGLAASALIVGIFLVANYIFAGFDALRTSEGIRWLVNFNLMIGILNLIPGFPLDMGRILRTIIWLITDDYRNATRAAINTGWTIGLILILVGVALLILAAIGLVVVFGGWLAGLWVAFSGWFLLNAASDSRRQAHVRDEFHGATARYMMNEDYTPIKQQFNVRAAREYIKNSGQNYFVVLEEGKLLGIVTLKDVKIPKPRWDTATIKEVMTPVSQLQTTSPDDAVADSLEQMEDYDINQIPVVEQGKLIGIVSRYELLRFLKTRSRLEE